MKTEEADELALGSEDDSDEDDDDDGDGVRARRRRDKKPKDNAKGILHIKF